MEAMGCTNNQSIRLSLSDGLGCILWTWMICPGYLPARL